MSRAGAARTPPPSPSPSQSPRRHDPVSRAAKVGGARLALGGAAARARGASGGGAAAGGGEARARAAGRRRLFYFPPLSSPSFIFFFAPFLRIFWGGSARAPAGGRRERPGLRGAPRVGGWSGTGRGPGRVRSGPGRDSRPGSRAAGWAGAAVWVGGRAGAAPGVVLFPPSSSPPPPGPRETPGEKLKCRGLPPPSPHVGTRRRSPGRGTGSPFSAGKLLQSSQAAFGGAPGANQPRTPGDPGEGCETVAFLGDPGFVPSPGHPLDVWL